MQNEKKKKRSQHTTHHTRVSPFDIQMFDYDFFILLFSWNGCEMNEKEEERKRKKKQFNPLWSQIHSIIPYNSTEFCMSWKSHVSDETFDEHTCLHYFLITRFCEWMMMNSEIQYTQWAANGVNIRYFVCTMCKHTEKERKSVW